MTEDEVRAHLIAEHSARMAKLRSDNPEITQERFDEMFPQKRFDEAIENYVSLWKNGHLVPVKRDGEVYFRYCVNIGQKHGDKR